MQAGFVLTNVNACKECCSKQLLNYWLFFCFLIWVHSFKLDSFGKFHALTLFPTINYNYLRCQVKDLPVWSHSEQTAK